jgi:hypothetical protein
MRQQMKLLQARQPHDEVLDALGGGAAGEGLVEVGVDLLADAQHAHVAQVGRAAQDAHDADVTVEVVEEQQPQQPQLGRVRQGDRLAVVEPLEAQRLQPAADEAVRPGLVGLQHRRQLAQPGCAMPRQQLGLALRQTGSLRPRQRPVLQGELHLDELASRVALLGEVVRVGRVRGAVVGVLDQRLLERLAQGGSRVRLMVARGQLLLDEAVELAAGGRLVVERLVPGLALAADAAVGDDDPRAVEFGVPEAGRPGVGVLEGALHGGCSRRVRVGDRRVCRCRRGVRRR